MWPDELWQLKGYEEYFKSDERFDFQSIPWLDDGQIDSKRAFEACFLADVAILFFHPSSHSDQQANDFCSRLKEKGIKIVSNDFLYHACLADFDYLKSLCVLPRILAEKLQRLVAS
jgi:hypothetical protein